MEQSSIIDKPVANGRISPDSKQMRRKTLSPLLFLGPEKARKKNKTRIEAGFSSKKSRSQFAKSMPKWFLERLKTLMASTRP